MLEFLEQTLQPHFNFWIYVILMMIGLWAIIAKNNLIKKLIGLSLFQTAIILFYVSLGVKEDATIPIIEKPPAAKQSDTYDNGPKEARSNYAPKEIASDNKNGGMPSEGKKAAKKVYPRVDPNMIANPLPHVLMLTAIVVGVATLGVALALVQVIFREFGTLEEDEVLKVIKEGGKDE
jgi:multicomponent Na+:H+ antiporter subunit C